MFLQVWFAESSSQACLWQQHPRGFTDFWFYCIVHWPAGNTQFKIWKLLTLQEICAPAGLWFKKKKKKICISSFVPVSCFWHQCLLSLSLLFEPLLVCYWADHGFPWSAWVGNVTEQELSQHIAAGIEQLEWALAFLSICLTKDMVCRLRYCSPDCCWWNLGNVQYVGCMEYWACTFYGLFQWWKKLGGFPVFT